MVYTDEVLDTVRGVMQFLRGKPGATFSEVRKHCIARGDDMALWPDWALAEEGYVTESAASMLVYEILNRQLVRPEAGVKTKKEHWQQWAIDGMPGDKRRLAEATWEAALSSERPATSIKALAEEILSMPRYDCAGAEGDYNAGMEPGDGYLDYYEVEKVLQRYQSKPQEQR